MMSSILLLFLKISFLLGFQHFSIHVDGFVPISLQSHHSVLKQAASKSTLSLQQQSSTEGSQFFNFDELTKFSNRLDAVEGLAPEYIMDFYDPTYQGFSVKPGQVNRLSITSSCYAILALLAARSSGKMDATIQWEGTTATAIGSHEHHADKELNGPVSLPAMLQALLSSDWREEDMFQVSLLLYTILKAGTLSNDGLLASEAIQKLSSVVLKARPQRRFGSNQVFSDYIQFQCSLVYSLLQQQQQSSSNNNANNNDELYLALSRSAEASWNELCRQLAYRSAGDSTNFDIMRLAYSLLAYSRASKSLLGVLPNQNADGVSNSAPHSMPMNSWLVTAALDAFFQEQQQHDGLWAQGQPIYKSFRRQGRNVGNAFVFSIDTVASLLEEFPAPMFRPHLGKLEKMMRWIEDHGGDVDLIPDPTMPGQTKAIRGWSSPHLSPGSGPQAWSTAQVLRCVSQLRETVTTLLHQDVLAEFNGIAHSSRGPRPASWNRLLDSDLGMNDDGACPTIKQVLDDRILSPFQMGVKNPSMGAAYSAILFGPPGTAKTTICESLAERIGWDFLVIDTSVFLADGLTNVANRIRYVFQRLQALEECVILFDEIEEFCLDRETPGLSMESRMLTTAMLTAINDLRRKKQSVFFLATNRLRAFDSAIIRPGRFDMQLFVGTPNLESRILLFRQALSKSATGSSDTSVSVVQEPLLSESIDVFRSFLNSKWSLEGDILFFNYLESRQFATAVAGTVQSSGKVPSIENMERILRQQAAVMTVRGSVREEYIASMVLSRL